jgi:hypothetical protein
MYIIVLWVLFLDASFVSSRANCASLTDARGTMRALDSASPCCLAIVGHFVPMRLVLCFLREVTGTTVGSSAHTVNEANCCQRHENPQGKPYLSLSQSTATLACVAPPPTVNAAVTATMAAIGANSHALLQDVIARSSTSQGIHVGPAPPGTYPPMLIGKFFRTSTPPPPPICCPAACGAAATPRFSSITGPP